jgi:siroheme synthase
VLIDRGRRYDRVVRLKGGDPFVFGRGGEEVIALEAAKVPVEVVPGVSSAFALPALAGVPVTHRGFSSSVTVASGHHVDREHWMSLGATDSTLVLLMAVERRGEIARLLIDGGRDSKMPVLVVERGATEFERRIVTELGQLANTPVLAPSVIVVGDVVTLGSID